MLHKTASLQVYKYAWIRISTEDRLFLIRTDNHNGYGPHLMHMYILNTILLKNRSAILLHWETTYHLKSQIF